MTDFNVTPSTLSLLGSKEHMIPWDADCWIYRDDVLVGTSATSLMLTGATLPYDVEGTPPPPRHPMIHHFVGAGLCRAYSQHIDQFEPSIYQLESTGLCRAHDPMGCKMTSST